MKKPLTIPGRKAWPSVSLLFPCDAGYPGNKTSRARIRGLIELAGSRLSRAGANGEVHGVIRDLKRLADNIDFRELSPGMGIFVSPYREQVIRFPFPVSEQVIVDRSFEIRDLLLSAQMERHYHLVLISEKKVRVFRVEGSRAEEMDLKEMPQGIRDTGGKGRSRTAVYGSSSSRRHVSDQKGFLELASEKYVGDIDRIIGSHPALRSGLFVLGGNKKLLSLFRKVTRNGSRLIGVFNGSFDRTTPSVLLRLVDKVWISFEWKREETMIQKLEDAMGKKRAVTGMEEVWKAARHGKGRLLLIEKDLKVPARTGRKRDRLVVSGADPNDFRYRADAADDIMEMVLKSGGEVYFTGNGRLNEYGRIGLVTWS